MKRQVYTTDKYEIDGHYFSAELDHRQSGLTVQVFKDSCFAGQGTLREYAPREYTIENCPADLCDGNDDCTADVFDQLDALLSQEINAVNWEESAQ